MERTRTSSILNKVLIAFLLLQPLCDIYMGVVGERLDIFGVSFVTIFRTAVVLILFISVVVCQIKNRYHMKSLYAMLAYLIVVFVYVILHHMNIVNSNGYFVTHGIYNFMTEVFYVERLLLPVILLYAVILIKPSKREIEKTIAIAVTFISVVIIVTNIFKVSFASYSPTNNMVSYNFVEWFTNHDLSYKETLSKGFFVSANQMGALIVVLFPIVIYYVLKQNKKYWYIVLLLQVISMVLIGTRVAGYGWILVSLALICLYIALLIMKIKPKPPLEAMLAVAVIFEFGLLLFVNSPAQNRKFASSYEGMYNDEIMDSIKMEDFIEVEDFIEMLNDKNALIKYLGYSKDLLKEIQYEAKCKYILDTYKLQYITTKYVKDIYPYTDDPDFWLQIFNEPASIKGDNRHRQVAIIKRIKQNNNNTTLDTIFGMGATPLNSRGYMIENDIISHYYNLGVVGMILFILPFLMGILYALWLNRKNIFNVLNIHFDVYVLSICMAYFTGYFAGHVLDEYIISMYIAVLSGVIFNYYRERKEETDVKTKT